MRVSTRKTVFMVILSAAVWLFFGFAVAADKVEVTLWHHWDGERMELVQNLLDDFMAENPDIEAKQLLSPPTSNADRLMTLLLGGAAPEIVMVNSSFGIQIAHMGGFMALDDLIARDGIDIGEFNDADLRGFQLRGQTFALPVMSGIAWTNLLFYNKRLMDEAGLDSSSAPVTWAEWREAAVRMTRRSPEGHLTQIGTALPNTLHTSYWNGAEMWSEDWRRATVNTERVEEAAVFLRDLVSSLYGGYDEYRSFFGSGFNNAFYEDKAGFWRQNSAAFAHLPNFDLDWGVGLAPASGLHADATPKGLVESTWAYAIPSFLPPDKLEATWKLFKFLTTHENGAGWFARVQGRPSPIMAFNTHPEYLDNNEYWNVVIESANHVEFAPPVNLNAMSAHFLSIVRGNSHPQQGLEDAELALQNELDMYWRALE